MEVGHPCHTCQTVFPSDKLLEIHMKKAHIQKKLHTCNICHKSFGRNSTLSEHILIHEDPASSSSFQCSSCDKSYRRKSNLARHVKAAHSIVKPECSMCKRTFTMVHHLRHHEKFSCPALNEVPLTAYTMMETDPVPLPPQPVVSTSTANEEMDTSPVEPQAVPQANPESDQSEDETVDMDEHSTPETTDTTLSAAAPSATTTQSHCQPPSPPSLNGNKVGLKKSSPQVCPTCLAGFATPTLLKRHIKRLHVKALYTCSICERAFKRKDTLLRHTLTHGSLTSQKNYECDSCHYKCARKYNLKKHVKMMHLGEKTGSMDVKSHPLKDEILKELTDLKPDVKEEPEEITPSLDTLRPTLDLVPFFKVERLEPNQTLEETLSKENVLMNSKTDPGNLKNCENSTTVSWTSANEICEKADTCSSIEKRLNTSEKQDVPKEKTTTKANEVYLSGHSENIFCKCMECVLKFKEAAYKYQRQRLIFECDICKRSYKDPVVLKNHKKTNCGTLRPHLCTLCGRGYVSKSRLKSHILYVHEGIRQNFICAVCKKVCHSKSALVRHVKIHAEEKELDIPQTCEICQKVFKNEKSYKNHKLRFHSGGHFVCVHCSKVFTAKQTLRGHMLDRHLMIQKIQCDLCSVKLVTEEGYKKHKATQHPNNSKYSYKLRFICEECGKQFRDKRTLDAHMNIHKGIKPYVCEVCGKCFRTDSNLEQHSRTHSDARPYVCDLCGSSFRVRNHLRQHMAVHGLVNTSVKRKRKQKFSESESDSDV